MDKKETCPICELKWASRCKCLLNEKICPNGHSWFTCPVHKKTVIGDADHSLNTDICQCNRDDKK